MQDTQPVEDPLAVLKLGIMLGKRRAFASVSGRCSAATVQLLRRIREEKLYQSLTHSWREFCNEYLGLSRRHADHLIGLLKRFGPVYFELSELIGVSPRQYLAIEPAVHEDRLVVDGEAISLIPENTPKLREAVDQLLAPPQRRPATPVTLHTRIAAAAERGRAAANELVALYESCYHRDDRERIVEIATELRIILMQPQ
jgi:hypothetical protein